MFGQHHLGMDDAALGREIVAAIKRLVAQPRARAVGGGGHRAGARLAANDLDVKMIDRHRDQIIYTAKFSGGITPSQTVLVTLQHYTRRPTIITPSTLLENVVKALQDKARDLKSCKVQRLGELVIATGADALSSDELAGALIMIAETKDTARKEAWAKRGVAFFQSRARRTAPAAERNAGGSRAQSGGAQPSTGSKGAA